jgi:hypothetical protein
VSAGVRWTWSWACSHSDIERCQSCDYDGYWDMALEEARRAEAAG